MICKSNDGAVGGVENPAARQSAIGEKSVATQVRKRIGSDGRLLASKAKDAAPRQSAIGEKKLASKQQCRIGRSWRLPESMTKASSA